MLFPPYILSPRIASCPKHFSVCAREALAMEYPLAFDNSIFKYWTFVDCKINE